EEHHAVDGPQGGDGEVGQRPVALAVAHELDGRHQREVDVAGRQRGVQLGGHAVDELGCAAVAGPRLEPPVEGRHVGERHDAEALGPHAKTLSSSYSASRRTGTRPASFTRRTSSSSVMPFSVTAPLACAMRSSLMVPSMSEMPAERATWVSSGVIMIQ